MDPTNALASCNRYTTGIIDKSHPRSVTLVKDKNGFGFTLRHFIVYPPTSSSKTKQGVNEGNIASGGAIWQSECKNKPMDTIFIREVKEGSPAHTAGLNKGDRIIAINSNPLSGRSYSDIIHLILKSGHTLRLLVVPKEDDILQLYFASSAYQPVHRESKQRKYLIPSDSDQSNPLCRQSAYGTYPGRIHKKVKVRKDADASISPTDVSKKSSSQQKDDDQKVIHSPVKDLLEGSCFSEDEAMYQRFDDFGNSDILELQSPKLKETVTNLYYNLYHNQSASFSSEENLNYPIYMSDFDDIVHCDNLVESQSITEALQMAGTDPLRCAYKDEESFTRDHNVCDKKHNSNCSCISNLLPYWTNSQESDLNSSSGMYPKEGDRNSIACDFSENPNVPSINLVAQRRHQFESGGMLVESMERMNLHKSELSRMSKPNHVQIVSSRAAEFESKSQSLTTSTLQKSINRKEEFLSQPLHFNKDIVPSTIAQRNSVSESSKNEVSTALNNVEGTDSASVTLEFDASAAGVVHHRRRTVPVEQDECHIVRRISYLRATAGERMNVESDLSEEETSNGSSPNKDFRIQKLKSFFGEKTPKVKEALVADEGEDVNGCSNQETNEEAKLVYGWVICKVVSLEGKRSSDRSWRHLWAVLRDNTLYLLKERREPSKGTISGDEHVINVKYSIAKAANDYVKRKHVLRLLLLNGSEYLFQTESNASMVEWLKALQLFAKEISELPQWLRNTSVLEKAAAYEQHLHKGKGQHHNVRKLVFRHRSPSEHSPTIKTRRASQGDELALTKIGVLWRDRMVQGWKKVHGTNSHIPKGASFGVKLENSPPGVTNEHIPLLVELCVQIVESRGLETVGIYRVPGNNASVSVLTDRVNQGMDDELLKDSRWNDVNIVSSLLKAYFRKLPEPLLTSPLYPKFIQASEVDDPVKRLKAIKQVLHYLPVQYFTTLKYLMYHLKKVVEHSDINKMEARNLAIVFGPTLVRATDNNMVAMVTDMPQQCYLIETMITYAEWLFEDCGDILPIEISVQDKRKTHPPSTALLSNINRLEEESLPHEMFTSLRNAASRHLRHRPKKKDPSSYAKKRSGIIADDTDILAQIEEGVIPTAFEQFDNTKSMEVTSDTSFDNSSLDTGSQQLQNSMPEPGSDLISHRYDKLSVLAQEKIRNFEQETKALLRRDVQKPRASTRTPQVEWEQIEKEWQKAKLELEQEDLLDYLADDPSYLSCLLNRESLDQPHSLELDFSCSDTGKRPLSSSSSSVQEIPNTSKTSLDGRTWMDSSISRTKSEIPTSISQPVFTFPNKNDTNNISDSKMNTFSTNQEAKSSNSQSHLGSS